MGRRKRYSKKRAYNNITINYIVVSPKKSDKKVTISQILAFISAIITLIGTIINLIIKLTG